MSFVSKFRDNNIITQTILNILYGNSTRKLRGKKHTLEIGGKQIPLRFFLLRVKFIDNIQQMQEILEGISSIHIIVF